MLMNIDTIAGEGTNLKGRFKETLGDATNDPALRQDGMADQISGTARKAIGDLRDFAERQPLVAAAAAVLIGFALLGGLRRDAS
jgi:uncharacterized protein YjbJ (UPF0337 family)